VEHEEYEMMYRAEDHHWWYTGMRAISTALLERRLAPNRDLTILDAGCGTGSCMQWLQQFGQVAGIDLAPEAVSFCRQRGLERLGQATICSLPFVDAGFDLVTSFDVMSACDTQAASRAIDEFHRVLRPGGHLLLRLPAYQWLYSRHDQLVHTRHRFSRGEIARRLREHGFDLEHTSYANCLLFPLAAAKRIKDKLLPPKQACSDVSVTGGWMNPIFSRMLRSEAPLISRFGLPFGLTVVALARKPAAAA